MAAKSPSEIILEALEKLDQPTTPSEIVRYARRKHPNVDDTKIRSQVTACCVNMPSRVSFPENQTPRIADDPLLDCLFRVDFGQYVRYDPEEHGRWEIAEVEGELLVRMVEETPASAQAPPEATINARAERVRERADESEPAARPQRAAIRAAGPEAAAAPSTTIQGAADMEGKEARPAVPIHDALIASLNEIEPGLIPHPEDPALRALPVPLAETDLLARAGDGGLVILKVFSQPPGHQFITDLLVNLGWAKEHLENRDARAIVLTPKATDELRFAVRSVPGIKLMTYEYKLVFTAV